MEINNGGATGIKLEHIDKSYNSLKVLSDFSIELPVSGIVGFSGPSGCGKTTLLRIMSGLEQADKGKIAGLSDKQISMVFQEDRLLPWLTVTGNLAAVQSDPTVIRYYLESMHLTAQSHSYPDSLSGGMQRRAALARALSYGGSVFMLDEPFKGLDLELKQDIAQHILDIGKNSLVLLVSHEEFDLLQLADEIIYFSGPPLNIIKRIRQKRESHD